MKVNNVELMALIDYIITIWLASCILVVISMLGFGAFNTYALIKFYLYFRKNNPERLDYLWGKDLIDEGWQKGFIIQERGLKWLYSELDEENDEISKIKKVVKISVKFGFFYVYWLFLSMIGMVFGEMLGLF